MIRALVCALLLGGVARADVVPDGEKYIPVTYTLSGIDRLGEHALMLVTLNERMRNHVQVQPDVAEGPLAIPSSYRDYSFLVALTPAQVKELDAVRAGAWKDEPHEHTDPPSKLRVFFDREDLARSHVLDDRTLVPKDDERTGIARMLDIRGIGQGRIAFGRQAVVPSTGSSGGTSMDHWTIIEHPTSPWLWVGLGLAVGAILGAIWWVSRRRRRVS